VTIDVRILGKGDASVLERVADDVFDSAVDAALSAEFLADPRHHLAVALDGDVVVGIASGVHYVHPDKPPQLFINEVGVTATHQGRGIGRRVLDALLERGRSLGCSEAWVLTDESNSIARKLYASAGGEIDSEPAIMYTFPLS
jgi:ribosomal protein S18 acetylase RimI-like enzyme